MDFRLSHTYFEVIAVYEGIRNLREDRDMFQQGLDKIADLFETSIDYLVNRTDIEKPYPRKK